MINKMQEEQDNHEHVKLSKVDKLVTDCILSDNEIKSTKIGLFEEMIKMRLVSPNDALPIIVKEMKSISDLGMVIICLRNGADKNIYVNVKGMGPAHIIIFAYNIHYKTNKKLFEMFYNLLILNGSSTLSPSYDSKIPKNHSYGYLDSYDKQSIVMESVYEWIVNKSKGEFKLPSVASEIFEYIKSNETSKYDRSIYAVYLDDNTLCEWDAEMLIYMLYSRNPNWKKLKIIKKDSIYLKVGFNATFLDLVVSMLDDGLRPSYIDFSFWVAHYKYIYSYPDIDFLVGQCESMFLELIKRGYQIDLYYLDEIGSINPQFRIQLIDEYTRPLWSKICNYKTDQYIPDEMKEVAIYFGIPEGSSKEMFCNSVEHITSVDLDSLIRANRERNSQAIASKLNFLTDYINNKALGHCDNMIDFNDNPMDYPSNLLAYYNDNNGKTWCFLSKDFERLIHTQINPSTKMELPKEFINRLKYQTDALKFFNIPLSEPKTLAKLISVIKKNDTPTNDKTNEIVQRVLNALLSRGINEDIILGRMKIKDIVTKFKRLGVDIQDILLIDESEFDKTIDEAKTEFSPRIILNIICMALDEKFNTDISSIEQFSR